MVPQNSETEITTISLADRNNAIAELLEEGKLPLLAFEQEHFTDKAEDHKEKQAELSKQLSDAMASSSETWHDNAPAEALYSEASVLTSIAKRTHTALLHGYVQEYPGVAGITEGITLGSVVEVMYQGDDEAEYYILTGNSRELPMHIQNLLPDKTSAATISSPIGGALFGSYKDDEVSFKIRDRSQTITVKSVAQFDGTQPVSF